MLITSERKGEKTKNILMSKGAKTLVEVCAAVKPRENVPIVTDFAKMSIAEAVATVEKGMITDIEGGRQARLLADDLKRRNDFQGYNVAELGVGLNPKCIMQGIMLEDEGVFGSVHVEIGTNISPGGNVQAAIHCDLLMYGATTELEGNVVLEKGEVRL